MLQTKYQRVVVALNKLAGRAREWAFTCSASTGDAFPKWENYYLQRIRTSVPHNLTYRVRSRFLSTRQVKNELSDYVQSLRTLIDTIQIDPFPMLVHVARFMEGLSPRSTKPGHDRIHYA